MRQTPKTEMSDQELDQLLHLATTPRLPLGAKSRLLMAMARENAIAAPVAQQQASRLGWLAGLPLAASLALGLYIGTAGSENSVLPSFAQDILADTTLDDTYSGIEDVEALTEDSLT